MAEREGRIDPKLLWAIPGGWFVIPLIGLLDASGGDDRGLLVVFLGLEAVVAGTAFLVERDAARRAEAGPRSALAIIVLVLGFVGLALGVIGFGFLLGFALMLLVAGIRLASVT